MDSSGDHSPELSNFELQVLCTPGEVLFIKSLFFMWVSTCTRGCEYAPVCIVHLIDLDFETALFSLWILRRPNAKYLGLSAFVVCELIHSAVVGVGRSNKVSMECIACWATRWHQELHLRPYCAGSWIFQLNLFTCPFFGYLQQTWL